MASSKGENTHTKNAHYETYAQVAPESFESSSTLLPAKLMCTLGSAASRVEVSREPLWDWRPL